MAVVFFGHFCLFVIVTIGLCYTDVAQVLYYTDSVYLQTKQNTHVNVIIGDK